MCNPTQQAEGLMAIRLRYTISTYLKDRGVTTPVQIGAAVGLSAAEAVGLLTRRPSRAGDVAWPEVMAGRLGLDVVMPGTDLPRGQAGGR